MLSNQTSRYIRKFIRINNIGPIIVILNNNYDYNTSDNKNIFMADRKHAYQEMIILMSSILTLSADDE